MLQTLANNKIDLDSKKLAALKAEYAGCAQALVPLRDRIHRTDSLIDLLVYRAYGLTQTEIAMVEDLSVQDISLKYQWPTEAISILKGY